MTLDRNILASSHVMVVGCGALGNEVLKNLALSGVGHIVCVDFDVVEKGNLTRSVLFRPRDAVNASKKTEVVRRRLLELVPGLDVQTIQGDIAFDVGLGIISDMDAVVACVDSRLARFYIGRHCNRTSRPWVDGGISFWEGSARVFEPGKNCYACSLDRDALSDLARRMPCANVVRRMEKAGSAPTSSILASVIGAVQAQETMKLLCGCGTLGGRMFTYEGDVMNVGTADFAAWDDDCPEHERWTPVERVPLSASSTVEDALNTLGGTFSLRDDCFVDYIENRRSGERTSVMLPGRKVEKFIGESKSISGYLTSDFYQHEYRTIDGMFPYKSLTLTDLGIPENDILDVRPFGGGRIFCRLEESVC